MVADTHGDSDGAHFVKGGHLLSTELRHVVS